MILQQQQQAIAAKHKLASDYNIIYIHYIFHYISTFHTIMYVAWM